MALPVLENTWVFNVNISKYVNEGSDEASARQMQLHIKNLLCGQLRTCYQGNFADQGGSVFRYTPSEVGDFEGHVSAFASTDVGKDIEFRNSTTPGNDGQFTITAVDAGGTWVEYTNASGATEAYSGSARVIDPAWATVVNGRSPWRCKGSGTGTLGRGSAMDGVDRWTTNSWNNQSNTSGNRTWFVFENEITGAEFCWWNDTNSNSYQWIRMTWTCSPENGFTGGTATTRPTATDEQDWINRAAWNGSDTAWDGGVWWYHMMVSDDGVSTNFWISLNQSVEYCALMVRQPSDVISDAAVPWNGSRNIMDWSRSSSGIFTYGSYSDNGTLLATIDKDGSVAGPYTAALNMTSEFFISAANPQYNDRTPNQVSEELEMFPIGLVCTTPVGVRGRLGRLSDLWFTTERTDIYPFTTGTTLPADGSHQFVKVGCFIFPWNGTKYENY